MTTDADLSAQALGSPVLLDTSAKTLSVDEVNQILAYAHARVTEPLLARISALERDAARMREAATSVLADYQRWGITADAIVALRATLAAPTPETRDNG